ncbi:MAG TPA: hypothetical protein VFZ61_13730 [Polyangiales bacterium]
MFALPLSGRLSLLFRPLLGYAREWRDLTLGRPAGASSAPSALVQPVIRSRNHVDIVRGLLAIQLAIQLSPNVALTLGVESWVDLLPGGGRDGELDQRPPYDADYSRTAGKWRVQVGLSAGLLVAL